MSEPSPNTPTTSLNGLVDDLVANEPKVREEIVSALQESTKESESETFTPETAASFLSSTPENPTVSGNGGGGVNSENSGSSTRFDPAIHETNADGTPRLKLDGTPRRKRGRGGTPSGKVNATPITPVNFGAMGQMFAGLFFGTTERVFGPAWVPQPDERSNIENATTRVCEVYGIGDVPPVLGLVLVVSLYALPRLNDPETKTRMRGFGERLGIVKPLPKARPQVGAFPPTVPNADANAHGNGQAVGAQTLGSAKIPVGPVENPLSQFHKG